MRKSNAKTGFTLMEMLIVVTIIGILAAIVLPRFLATTKSAEKAAHKAERQTINKQLESYYARNGEFPSTGNWELKDWPQDKGPLSYFPDGVPVTCNQGAVWVVNNGRIILTGHDGHE